MSATIFERVSKVLQEELSLSADEVKLGATIMEDLNADSLDFVEVVMAIEDEFGIDVSDDDVNGLKTVQDVVNYVERKTA